MPLLYKTELLATAVMAAHTTRDDIENKTSRAELLLRALSALSGRDNLLIEDLSSLLYSNSGSDKNLLSRLVALVNELLIDVPTVPLTIDEALEAERQIQWAA